jgi:hypothetical protein
MTIPEEDDDRFVEDVEHDIQKVIGALIDLNSQITLASRKLATDAIRVRDAHIEAAELCEVIAKLHGESARIAAQSTGDIISSEWGLGEFNDKCEDELADDDEEPHEDA